MVSKIIKSDKEPKTYAFIDAANLFYGGQKSLGWSVDYKKLHAYLKTRYGCKKIYYFGGIETHKFPHNYLTNETVPLKELLKYLRKLARQDKKNKKLSAKLEKYIQRTKFYKKLQDFGYHLVLKPVKVYTNADGSKRLKANCDLDMALCMIKDMPKYERALVLSSDGDFISAIKYIKHNRKDVLILARGPRTAKEIKHFAGPNFRDFATLRKLIEKTTKGTKAYHKK
jgi:uncharacterized LabA/DUF88 family protein